MNYVTCTCGPKGSGISETFQLPYNQTCTSDVATAFCTNLANFPYLNICPRPSPLSLPIVYGYCPAKQQR